MIEALVSGNELQKRAITGALGGVLLLLLIIFGGWLGIFFLTTVLSLGMIYEFCEMTFQLPDAMEKRYLLLSMGWFCGIVNLLAPQSEFELLIFCFLGLFAYALYTVRRYEPEQFRDHFLELMTAVFGVLYLIFLPLFLTRIYEVSQGVHWTVVFFLIVWAGDTGAYFAGKKYGEHKLYVAVSPKKTWEGAAGGLGAGLLVCLLYKLILFRNMPWLAAFAAPILVGATAQVGDLAESLLKRSYNCKDSGSILPGHGGFLDRFDGILFGLPVMYACIKILG